MSHVEHLVHLLPRRARLSLNGLKQHRNVHHVVFDDVQAGVQKVEHFGLCSARTMDHAVDLASVFLQKRLHHRGVGACGRQHQLARVQRHPFHGVRQAVGARIHELRVGSRIIAFWILFGQGLPKHVVPCRRQSVAAHAPIELGFVGRLSRTRQSHHHIASRDAAVVNHLVASHAGHHRGIHDDGAHQVPNVCGFTSG